MPPRKAATAAPAKAGNKPAGAGFSLQASLDGGSNSTVTAFAETTKGNFKVTDANGQTGAIFRTTLQKGIDSGEITTKGNDITFVGGYRITDGVYYPKGKFDVKNAIGE
jgi:hypothetical protein